MHLDIAGQRLPMHSLIRTACIALLMTTASRGLPAQDHDIETQIRTVLAKKPQIIQDIVRDYLLQNPDLVRQMLVEMIKQKSSGAGPVADRSAAIAANADALLASKHAIMLGNPEGDVTLVEFFDYNCGFCKRSLSDKIELLRGDPRLRIVLKEFPILGQDSLDAAKVAIALHMQDGASGRYPEFHRRTLSERKVDRTTALRIARELGADMERIERDLAGDEVRDTIAENMMLARNLGITGTPSYVVGNAIENGAVGLAILASRIKTARP